MSRPKLYAVIESYVPRMQAGSEMAAHTLFRYLVTKGWDVRVHETRNPKARYTLDGVEVVPRRGSWEPDLIYTHLFEAVPLAMAESGGAIPLVFWAHSNDAYQIGDVWIANSEHFAEGYQGSGEVVVLHPPVGGEYRTARDRARAVTRIGLSRGKGGHVWWELSRRMPDVEFLGVVGGWGPQLMEMPGRNVTVMGQRTDMLPVYEQTRVLIMPSDGHETYGRVGAEACMSGIPVLATPLPGVIEALGDAALYVDLGDVDCYEDTLRCLANERNYRHHSRLAGQRGEFLQLRAEEELANVERVLRKATK